MADPILPNSTARLLSAAASTNATSVKAAPGNLFKVAGVNGSAAAKFLKFYNKATAPVVGTDVPVLTIELAVGAFDLQFHGLYFSNGIAFALTGAAADADTTALAAADVRNMNIGFN